MSEQLAIPLEQAPSGGLTELVLTQNTAHSQAMVLPMIAHLSQQDNGRWLTWLIDDAIEPEKLRQFGVDTRRVRFVHCRERAEQLWVLWDALALGNSHTVVASPGLLDREEMTQLEIAAQRGGCQGVLLRQR